MTLFTRKYEILWRGTKTARYQSKLVIQELQGQPEVPEFQAPNIPEISLVDQSLTPLTLV